MELGKVEGNCAGLRALGVFTTVYMLTGFLGMSIAPLAPFIQDDLNLGRTELGLFVSLLYLGATASSIVAGLLSDRWSMYKTLFLGLALEGIMIGAVWIAAAFPTMLGLFFMAGLGFGVVNPVTSKGVVFWFPPERRATVMAVKQTGFTVGIMLASVLLPLLAKILGWRWSILAASASVLILGIASFIVYPASAERRRTAIPPVVKKQQVLGRAWTGEVVVWSLIGVFFAALQGAGTAYLAVYMVKDFSYSAVAAGFFLAVAQGSGAVGRILWGWASDRWFKKNREKGIVLIGLIAACAGILLGLLPPSVSPFCIGVLVAVFGFTAIGYNAVFLTLIAEIAGTEKAGQAIGLALTIGYIGIIVGPPVFGIIADKADDYAVSWVLYGMALAVVSWFIFIKSRYRQKNVAMG